MGSGHHEFGGDEIEQEPKVWGRTKGIDMEVNLYGIQGLRKSN